MFAFWLSLHFGVPVLEIEFAVELDEGIGALRTAPTPFAASHSRGSGIAIYAFQPAALRRCTVSAAMVPPDQLRPFVCRAVTTTWP